MAISKILIAQIEKEAKKYFKNASGCHDWTHVERVRSVGIKLAKLEHADPRIVEVAALLHDIRKNAEMKKKGAFCHAEAGAQEAAKILAKYKLDKKYIEQIIHCIATHRKRKGNAPSTIEAKVLFDADKLDSLGAVGIGRLYYFASSINARFYTAKETEHVSNNSTVEYTNNDSAYHEYLAQIRYIKDKMLTKSGRHLAQHRAKFMSGYFIQFWNEVKGRR
jgi:uncharacterized protein